MKKKSKSAMMPVIAKAKGKKTTFKTNGTKRVVNKYGLKSTDYEIRIKSTGLKADNNG